MYARYRNADERHAYEKETKTKISNVKSVDNFIEQRKRLKNAWIKGVNNRALRGAKNVGVSLQQFIDSQIK